MKKPTHDMVIHFETRGNHTHMLVYVGELDTMRGLAGSLIMRNEEFDAWRNGKLHIQFANSELGTKAP